MSSSMFKRGLIVPFLVCVVVLRVHSLARSSHAQQVRGGARSSHSPLRSTRPRSRPLRELHRQPSRQRRTVR
jgi:hypothetical protein